MKTVCISHVKDVDGLSAAAIVSAATGAEVILSDYEDLLDNMRGVKGAGAFVLCDLGADNSNLDEFLSEMKRLASECEVTYIDHHFMSPAAKRRLRASGVRLVHDPEECSSMLAFQTFRKKLPPPARLLALYGAVTDYMDGSPSAVPMMEREDRQFVLLESTMLSYSIGALARKEGSSLRLVKELARMKLPHEIEGVPAAAIQQLDEMSSLSGKVAKQGKKMGRLAYMVTKEYSTGNVAKLLIGAFDVPVGVAMKEKQPGWYETSLRSTSESRVHLGKTISKIAGDLGGSGGGHKKAAGCRVPVEAADKMLTALARKV